MDQRQKRQSKLLSLMLRHRPADFGVDLDARGWADLDAVLEAARAAGQPLDRGELDRILHGGDKRRFELDEEGRRIRATHGHSVSVEPDYEPASPPAILYHGTVARFLDAIRAEGLRPGARLYVHLSETREAAREVGARRGRPVILEVRAGALEAAGHTFFRAPSGVWLTERVPPAYVVLPGARPGER